MKILELEIEGFHSLRKVVWQPGDLNITIGRNGSGKSNLLRSLELISACVQGKLANYISAAGGMKALVWNGQSDKISFRLKTSFEPASGEEDAPKKIFVYNVVLVTSDNTSGYQIEKETLIYFKNNDVEHVSSMLLQMEDSKATIFNYKQEPLQLGKVESFGQESILRFAAKSLTKEQFPLIFSYAEGFKQWHIYPSLQAGCSFSDTLNLAKLYIDYDVNEDFKEQVDASMRAAFGNDFDYLEFVLDEQGSIKNWGVRRKTSPILIDASTLSDGTLRYLFFLLVFLAPIHSSLLAIDEPETGLHPYIAGIVAELATHAARHNPVFLTTHSPEFLSAFDKDSLPTITFSRQVKGETKLNVLDPARLRYWLKEYSLGQLFMSGQLENMALDDDEEME